MTTNASLVVVALLTIGACDDTGHPAHVELSGQTPSEGAHLAADALCSRAVRCGTAEIQCVSSPEQSAQCSATIVHPDKNTCYTQVEPGIEDLLACPSITPSQVDMIEQCLDAMNAQPCITQIEADEAAKEEANGMSPRPAIQPIECEFLQKPLPGC
jgi:hypothetical protein